MNEPADAQPEQNAPKSPEDQATPTAESAAATERADAPATSSDAGNDAGEAGASTEDKIVTMLKTVYDPEIPVDIHELGLIYAVDLNDEGLASIRMTLTSPNCPAAESLPSEVETKVKTVEGVTDAKVEIVWDPPWSPDLMSEAAKLELGMW